MGMDSLFFSSKGGDKEWPIYGARGENGLTKETPHRKTSLGGEGGAIGSTCSSQKS